MNETAVYRAYSEDGSLLYIGVSENLWTRMQNHRCTKPWWSDVARITARFYPDARLAAFSAERIAIKAERPLYNKIALNSRRCRVCGGSFQKDDLTSVTHAKCSSRT